MQPGDKLAHYEITAPLGKGGMGEVFAALDPRAGRKVALKVLPASFAQDAERLARFRREAKVLGSLNHPNIATLYGVDEHGGQPFLVMELAEGRDLSRILAEGPLSLDQSLDIALQIAKGLEEAHEKGVIHRDLKPANIMLAPDGQVKILDFGLARAYEGESTGEQESLDSPTITAAMTAAGTILGTAAYMSPEQARGRGIDRRSDLWAFGAILWEVLTGRRLFQGETVSDTLAEILKSPPPWDDLPTDTPQGVRRLLERCLERDPRNRLRDIGEARIRLQKWESDPSLLDESFGSFTPAPPENAARRFAPWAVALVAALAAVFFAVVPRQEGESGLSALNVPLMLEDVENMSLSDFEVLDVSPDGEYFLWSTGSGLYIRHRSADEGTLVPGTESVTCAAFSPDSRQIALSHTGSLFRMSVTGSQPIRICEAANPRGLDWVDNETIIITLGFVEGLHLVDVTDGSLRELTQRQGSERSHRWPSMIPGTRQALFMAQFTGREYQESVIEVVDVDTGQRTVVHRGGAYPRIAPTGHLLFARDFTIFAIAFDKNALTTSGLAVPVLENVLTRVNDQEIDDGSVQFGFDQAGNLIYRRSDRLLQNRSTLAWLDLATGRTTPFDSPSVHGTARLSPDGRFLASVKNLGTASEIHVRDLESGGSRIISTLSGTKYGGVWSPDSRSYFWSRGSLDGEHFEVVRGDRAGGSPPEVLIQVPATCFAAAVTPDGRGLLVNFYTNDLNYEIGYLALDEAEPELRVINGGPGNQFARHLSPDGKFLLYGDTSTALENIFISRFPDTGDRWRVGTRDMDHADYRWTHDGQGIYILDAENLSLLGVDTTNGVTFTRREILTRAVGLRRYDAEDISLHPDGERAVILLPESGNQGAPTAEVIYREAWFVDLERIMAQR